MTHAGTFNYLYKDAVSSLFRNGKVYARRDVDGSDGGAVGIVTQSYDMTVINARTLDADDVKTCEAHGFELQDAPADADQVDYFDHTDVVRRYYPSCESLVSQATGARAYAFDHNIRSATGKQSNQRISGGQTVQGPAKLVHGDYTLFSAPQRLRDLAQPPKVNDTLAAVLPAGKAPIDASLVNAALQSDGRFAIINVWRNIAAEPVQINPLAMCDGRTVEPEDLVTFEIHYADRIGENYFAKFSPRHRYYFYPHMNRDEALLLKQWDSHGALARSEGVSADGSIDGPCTFSFHSAFDDAQTPDDAPDRLSIEVRCAVIYS